MMFKIVNYHMIKPYKVIAVSEATYNRVSALSKKHGMSRAEIVRQMIEYCIKQTKEVV